MGLGSGGGTPMSAPTSNAPLPFRSSAGKEIVGNAVPRPTTLAEFTARPDALNATPQRPQSSYARTVKMVAPDGSVEDVDEGDVSLFERAGARRA